MEVREVGRAVLDSEDLRLVHRPANGFQFDGDLGQGGHVVEKER